MGRVFTTIFEYKGELHTAVVSVYEEPAAQTRFCVRLLNDDFYQLIPNGTLTYTSLHDSPPASIHNRAAAELFLSVQTAIASHLSD